MSIVEESSGYIQVFSDGSVKRADLECVPESQNSFEGYQFKDVTIDGAKPITARLFVPTCTRQFPSKKFPLVVYFHGGGFCIGSTTWLGYHHFLGDFSSSSHSIVLSINYRLAPEHRLPIAYEDCYSALEWLNTKKEPWLEQVDLSRVFLSGDSAGGNITHQVAVKATRNEITNIKIKGLMLIHPYFGSEKRTEKEIENGVVATNDMFWRLSIPKGSNRDYFGCNFEKQEDLGEFEWAEFLDVVVYVAGLDSLKERGEMYADFVKKRGVREVKVVEAEKESHVFHVFDPKSDASSLLRQQMTEFINNH